MSTVVTAFYKGRLETVVLDHDQESSGMIYAWCRQGLCAEETKLVHGDLVCVGVLRLKDGHLEQDTYLPAELFLRVHEVLCPDPPPPPADDPPSK